MRLAKLSDMRILVIEDDPKLADYLLRGLRENGHVADSACDGIDGLHMARYGAYDVVLLDVMLPGLDGIGVLHGLRNEAATRCLPVLMLTARDRVKDRIQGLHAGADDYLGKPFALTELLARLKALMERGPESGSLESGALRLADGLRAGRPPGVVLRFEAEPTAAAAPGNR